MKSYLKILAILAMACLGFAEVRASRTRTYIVSPLVLNGNPTFFDKKIVFVRGFIKLSPEGHILYESKGAFDEFTKRMRSGSGDFNPNDYKKYCLTIANPSFLYRHIREFGNKTIILKGKFIKDYLTAGDVDIGACPLPTGIIIDTKDLKRRFKI